ncbi:hypothetical protein EX895_002791 [Sporisorium graminicola]|uniref:Uncharacterized protein n=1 Tax=Sporisorium graminicola TaxID=280036 RepID=A0A4V6ETY8_9BASI|nr:hypothetical protein EX895_002791 [Sporisorium graminicola]TKY88439.1 hypothetical protein EX895_002791 [Sporisorium graminicola]
MIPTPLVPQAGSELDDILRAAQMHLPPLSTDAANIQESARSLITTTQKARMAIAQDVVDSAPFYTRHAAVTRAKALQDELMDRAQSHLIRQLDQMQRLEEVEWKLHRGFKEGAAETEQGGSRFTRHTLQPGKWKVAETGMAHDTTLKQRIEYVGVRIKENVRNIDPMAATRRWRIRRLMRKLSAPPLSVGGSPSSSSSSVSSDAPVAWDMRQLRARLSSVTALKSTQSESAAAEARDASAAAREESAPAIQSDLVLQSSPKRMQKQTIGKDRAPTNKEPFKAGWVQTYIKAQGGRAPDWNVPIPAMENPVMVAPA